MDPLTNAMSSRVKSANAPKGINNGARRFRKRKRTASRLIAELKRWTR